MLKHRLLYGTLMTVFFTGLVIFDGWVDGNIPASVTGDKPMQGTILCIIIALLIISSQIELSKLAAAKNLKIFTPVSIIASILFSGTWYWLQLVDIRPMIYISLLSAFSLAALFLYQYLRYGTSGVITNCGASYFSIIYLGLLAPSYSASG